MSGQKPATGRSVLGVLALLFGGALVAAGPGCGGKQSEEWLADRQQAAVTINPHVPDPAHDGKLVHVTGPISTGEEPYRDPLFHVSARGFALVRQAAQYGYAGGDGGAGDG